MILPPGLPAIVALIGMSVLISLSEIAFMAAGAAPGALLEQEHRLMRNVSGLQDRCIIPAMTPRDEIVFLDLRESLESQREKGGACPCSGYPPCDDGLDTVAGEDAFPQAPGSVMHRLRRVARTANRIEAAGCTVEVVDVAGFRINRLLVTRQEPA